MTTTDQETIPDAMTALKCRVPELATDDGRVPDPCSRDQYVQHLETGEWVLGWFDRLTVDAQRVHRFIRKLLDSYNYDGSEVQVDYFDVNFHTSIDLRPGAGAGWDDVIEAPATEAVPA